MAKRIIRSVLALIACVGCMADIGAARADEPLPPTPDTNPEIHPQSPAQVNLLLIGAAVTAGWYVGGVGVSYLWSDSPGAAALRIPVAGPYMALAKTGCGERENNCDTLQLVIRTVLTGLSAVGQTGGVLAMIEGAFLPIERSGMRKSAHLQPQDSPTVVPFVSADDGLGFGVSGNF
jgi:hypothetical protein